MSASDWFVITFPTIIAMSSTPSTQIHNPGYLLPQTTSDLTYRGRSGEVDFSITRQDERLHQRAWNDVEEWYPSCYQVGWHQVCLGLN